MFDKIDVLAMATRKMNWLAKRQEVLSENIANADTPKYVPRDLKPLDFKAALQQVDGQPTVLPVATNPRHIVPRMTDPNTVEVEDKTYESSPDGNAVVLEEQMAKVGDDRAAYEVASSLFQKQVQLLKLVTAGH